MKRGKSYIGTAFFIHPRVLITAGHNVRKRPQFIYTRVKQLTLRFGATDRNTNLYQTTFATTQNDNIYTLQSFNKHYSIEEDYGVIILPDEEAYKKVNTRFTLTPYDANNLTGKPPVFLAGYPSEDNKLYCTLWEDNTTNYIKNDTENYMRYEFYTEHGVSGAPVWYTDSAVNYAFAIHTNGDPNKKDCSKATIITKKIYDDISRFCLSKGIDITK
ncbi:MAG: trypsin-like serine protease [Sphingobacteriales bacterium JAD_PAG50586_3]|nr:MAG: trypsin-like serine protease [Sphingobacteriales bacterium JAD_PAG50586_3]